MTIKSVCCCVRSQNRLTLHKGNPVISAPETLHKHNPISPTPHFSLSLSNPTSSSFSHISMAQKREKEETELKVPETLTLCTPPITTASSNISTDDRRSSPDLKTDVIVDLRTNSSNSPEKPDLSRKRRSDAVEVTEALQMSMSNGFKKREVNRCSGCKRKVGLIGFRCRCGEMFCSEHRYSDRHDCSYDYKAAGREAIARENPVVRAAKILKV
ncbi:hypothetical protein QVD17_36416 [Tagetes erecta]|uniref:AN1-type domain-containing protein n=1 Tax=Tagetes erecta TaxID=13708 RepID=A0AAD8JWC9_TARER|nr:hypothetical protein QVD17_36416 [Tagetes erecta]